MGCLRLSQFGGHSLSMKPTHTDRGPLAGAGLTLMKPGFVPWHRSVGLFSG